MREISNSEQQQMEENTVVTDINMTESYEQPTETELRQQQQENDNTMTYSNITTKNEIFRGKLTLTANIQQIRDFNTDWFCRDIATKQPRAWLHVLGVQPIHKRTLELQFDNEHAMNHIQTNGLDTHNIHLNFIPDQLLVTTVSFWGIPLGMEAVQVDEHLQRFGEIKSHYLSRKNMGNRNIKTGVRVYSIILKKPLTKFIQIGGKSVKTLYTGQDRHLQQEREKRQMEREQRDHARQDEYITEQNTDANVSTNIIQHVNTTTNATENRYEDITEDDNTELRPTLTKDLLLNALNTNRDILRKTDVTEDTADITDFIKVPGKRKKKKTGTDDETEKKRKAIHKYKIDIDILQQIVLQHEAIDKLLEEIFA